MTLLLNRRRLLLATVAAGAAPWSGCASRPDGSDVPPIVFVHGDGDTAGLWMPTVWRFESNGWPRDRLHAIEMPYPVAREDDTKAQAGRSSTAEQMAYLAGEVRRVLAATGASKVALVGNSRGGYAIRNFIAFGGGAPLVSHVVLGGTPNHGITADAATNPGNEYNGAGPFLSRLNAPQGADGSEVAPGIRWMTIRSDNNDKYAQPFGIWLRRPTMPTHVTFDGPALKGTENVVIAGIDHRETAFSPMAFAAMYRFIAGHAPTTLAIVPEAQVVLDGVVSGFGVDNVQGALQSNLPLAGAVVEVHAVNGDTGERLGGAPYRKTTGADGRWGPFRADGAAHYEFVIAAAGYATTHIYRSPFPRSSSIVSMRPERLADADRDDTSLVVLTRPRGYFGLPRDRISLDGINPAPGIPSGVPGLSTARVKVRAGAGRAVVGEFNGERIVGRAWPAADNNIVLLELTY